MILLSKPMERERERGGGTVGVAEAGQRSLYGRNEDVLPLLKDKKKIRRIQSRSCESDMKAGFANLWPLNNEKKVQTMERNPLLSTERYFASRVVISNQPT